MRVAFVAEVTAHHRETDFTARIRRLAELLADRGHEVAVFCSRWWDDGDRTREVRDVTYRGLVDDRSSRRAFSLRVPGAVRSFRPDVVHVAPATAAAIYGAKGASVLSRAPLVLDWYDADDPRRWGLVGPRLVARLPARVITPSRTVRTRVREFGAADEDVRVVPNGIEMEAIRRIDPDHRADIVYSRRLDEDANLESLLLALAELRTRDWSVAVVGDGPERERYETQARDLRIASRVDFLGDLAVEERLGVFKGAHVYVHTARRTPFPTDLVRGLACGCVGVVEYHADSSAHEIVERRERAFLTTTEEELTDAIAAAGEMDRIPVDESFAEFDEEAVADRVLDCYRDLGAVADDP